MSATTVKPVKSETQVTSQSEEIQQQFTQQLQQEEQQIIKDRKATRNKILGSMLFIIIVVVIAEAFLLDINSIKTDIYKEIAKSLLNIIFVSLLGALITYFVTDLNSKQQQLNAMKENHKKRLEAKIEQRRKQLDMLNEIRKDTLKKLINNYVEVKKCRRIIRAKALSKIPIDDTDPILVNQEVYVQQIEIINNLQLNLEVIKQEIRAFSRAFVDKPLNQDEKKKETPFLEIKKMEQYLNDIVDEFEKLSEEDRKKDAKLHLPKIPHLQRFLFPRATQKEQNFDNFSENFHALTEFIQNKLLEYEHKNIKQTNSVT